MNFTGQDLAIGFGGVLGDLVTIDEQLALGVPNNQLAVSTLANLNIPGGALSVASAVNNGRIFVSGSTAIDFDADNQGNGLINNEDLVIVSSSVAGNLLNHGDFDVAGHVLLQDSVELTTGSAVNLLIGGDDHGEFGALTVGGNVSLAGELELSFTGGFAPSEGDLYEIIDVGNTLSGAFAGLPNGALVGNFGGVDLFIDYNAGDGNDVALSTTTKVDGNQDGHVDGVDFLALQRVAPAQIPHWQQQFGAAEAINAATSSVPEPTTMLLLVVGMGALLKARPLGPGGLGVG